jgi:hypothetical protein
MFRQPDPNTSDRIGTPQGPAEFRQGTLEFAQEAFRVEVRERASCQPVFGMTRSVELKPAVRNARQLSASALALGQAFWSLSAGSPLAEACSSKSASQQQPTQLFG